MHAGEFKQTNGTDIEKQTWTLIEQTSTAKVLALVNVRCQAKVRKKDLSSIS